MLLKLLIAIIIATLPLKGKSQTMTRIYTGEVNCDNKNSPKVKVKAGLKPIEEPQKKDTSKIIDISLTERSIGPMYYVRGARLYYDTIFKLEYWDTEFRLDTVTWTFPIKQKKSSEKYPNDSIFAILVKNGAFALPQISEREVVKNHKPAWLTNNTLEKVDSKFYVDDGSEIIFESKVGDCYSRRVFNNPQIYHDQFPDIQIFRRVSDIVTALFLNFD